MTWFRLDTSFPAHPKVLGLTPNAFRLHVCALALCAEHLTDGLVEPKTLQMCASLARVRHTARYTEELISAKLWNKNEGEEGGYRIHDYQQHQRTKADVEREKEQNRERVRSHRERQRNGVTQPLRNALVTPLVTQQIREDLYTKKALDLRVEAARPTSPTSQVVSKIEAYVHTVAINYPDERILREDLQDRFKTASPTDVEQGIQLWRQLTTQPEDKAEQAPEGLAS